MMIDSEMIDQLAAEIGFEYRAPAVPETFRVYPEVRAMCSADKCQSYGRSWSCPPACGDIEHLSGRMRRYESAILVQTVITLSDPFDMEAIRAGEQRHKRRFDALVRQLRLKKAEIMPLGAGTCRRCRSCTYPDRPCRYPDKLWPSMEACGLLVSEVCTRAGIDYYHGEGTMSFTSCVLYGKH